MKLNLNKPFVGLDGQELPKAEFDDMGKLLGKALAASNNNSNHLKFWDWALALHAGKDITIDAADRETLLKFVTEVPTFTALARAQIQRELTSLTP